MENRKVLIVEDDKMISTLSGMLLSNLEYTITAKTQTGEEAIENCEKNTPDIILMDVHLPGIYNGVETAGKIINKWNIPVIYLTSDTSIEVLNSMLLIPFYGLIIKPMSRDMLNIGLRNGLNHNNFLIANKIANNVKPIIFVSDNIIIYANIMAINRLGLIHEYDILGKTIENFIESDKTYEFMHHLLNLRSSNNFNTMFKTKLHSDNVDSFGTRLIASTLAFNNQEVIKLMILD